jgi:hypothetical protein
MAKTNLRSAEARDPTGHHWKVDPSNTVKTMWQFSCPSPELGIGDRPHNPRKGIALVDTAALRLFALRDILAERDQDEVGPG